MKRQILIIFTVLVIIMFHFPVAARDKACFPGREALQTWMARHYSTSGSGDVISDVVRFYQQVGYRPVWTGPSGLLSHGRLLIQKITNASALGLESGDYLLPLPETALVDFLHGTDDFLSSEFSPHIQLDIILTDRILRYARHVYQGKVLPEQIHRAWLAQRRSQPRDLPYELAQSIENDCFESFIESLHPRSEAYQRLLNALMRYEKIRRKGGWFPIDAGATLQPGDIGPRVAMLKYRLKLTVDGFDDAPVENDRFDERLASAVKQFQKRHGLNVDGLVGKATLTELNVPVEKRIDQLRLNMERWRWFPDSFGDRYLLVNIPAFELMIVNSGKTIDKIRVIVGKKSRQTPIMSDQMTYLELNPYWNIPQKIARKDILPKVKKDPGYLIQQGIRVFDSWESRAPELDPNSIDWSRLSAGYLPYRMRQDPSPTNALGQIKFIFPNPLSVYIHDTPGKSLFNRRERSFSSGCVRIEKPIALASHLIGDQGWHRDRLESAIAGKKPKAVVLAAPIPVHLVYFTAWVATDGTVNFRQDIYGHDTRLAKALHQPVPQLTALHQPAPKDDLMALFTNEAGPFASTHADPQKKLF